MTLAAMVILSVLIGAMTGAVVTVWTFERMNKK